MKGTISSFLAVFGCLKVSRGIFSAMSMQASFSDLGILVLAMFFSSLKRFSFTFSFSTMVHILLVRENGIFVKKCRGWFDVNGRYCFGSVGLL